MNTPTGPCRICGDQTPMLGTKLCDRCWELETRIRRDMELAEKILNRLKREKQHDDTSGSRKEVVSYV